MNESKEIIQLYSYVGPQSIIDSIDFTFVGYPIIQKSDVFNWIKETSQEIINDSVFATFIINENHQLVINDRHSEHVMCANGKQVISAGEISFFIDKKSIFINEISNQSTGYCPKPESWKYVYKVLNTLNIEHPDYFTTAFDFRICNHCNNINLIKDQIFECQLCQTDLALEWNFVKK